MTPKGMLQHFNLGRRIYNEYVNKTAFLSPQYKPSEIYFRSTDVNQTLLSANANLMGMYYNRTSEKAPEDYPAIADWPAGFLPVPVHTVLRKTDHIGNVEPECPRRDFLFEMALTTPEFKKYNESQQIQLERATAICGTRISMFDIWRLTEAYVVEESHRRAKKILLPDDFTVFRDIEVAAQSFTNGQGMKPMKTKDEEIDFATELPRVRSGALIKDMIDHIEHKISCMDNPNGNEANCQWMGPMKYYAYSSHWATINALFTALKVREKILSKRLPGFTATFIIELWNMTKGGYAIKARYRDNPGEDFITVTKVFPNCDADLCPYDKFKIEPMKVYTNDIVQLCNKVPKGWKPAAAKASQAKERMLVENKTAPKTRAERGAAPEQRAAAGDELLFIQAFWRHGDRTPYSLCPNDKNTASTWPGGLGELTSLGMKQQRRLGSLIYKKYVQEMKFLKGTYKADEIYIRSTDFNRTIVSAMSNFAGLYYDRPAAELNRDFPGEGWPNKFVSVPIHTVNRFTDHMGDPNTVCPRQKELEKLAIQTAEVQKIEKDNQKFLATISEKCGKKLGLMDLSTVVDTWLIEKIYNRTRLFTQQEYDQMRKLDRYAENVRHGLIKDSKQNGVDLRVQIPRLRGGSQLYNLIHHMVHKAYCLDHPEAPEEICGWHRKLLYYAFSAHDSTLNGLLSALGAKETVVPDDIPEYTAAIVFELWRIKGEYQVQANYHRNFTDSEWEDITGYISGCPKNATCPLTTFTKRSEPFNPHNITTLCNDLSLGPVTTTPKGSSAIIPSYLLLLVATIVRLFHA